MFKTKPRPGMHGGLAEPTAPTEQDPMTKGKEPMTKGFKIVVIIVAVAGVALTFALPEALKMMEPKPVATSQEPTQIDLTGDAPIETPPAEPLTPPDPALSGLSSAAPCQALKPYVEAGRNTTDLLAKTERELALEVINEMGCLRASGPDAALRPTHPDHLLLVAGRGTPEMYQEAISSRPECQQQLRSIGQLVAQERWEEAAQAYRSVDPAETCLNPAPSGGYYGFSSPRWDISSLVAKNVDALALIQISLIRGVPGCLPLVYEVMDIPAGASQWSREAELFRIRKAAKATGCLSL